MKAALVCPAAGTGLAEFREHIVAVSGGLARAAVFRRGRDSRQYGYSGLPLGPCRAAESAVAAGCAFS
jgi:hypothetical protein